MHYPNSACLPAAVLFLLPPQKSTQKNAAHGAPPPKNPGRCLTDEKRWYLSRDLPGRYCALRWVGSSRLWALAAKPLSLCPRIGVGILHLCLQATDRYSLFGCRRERILGSPFLRRTSRREGFTRIHFYPLPRAKDSASRPLNSRAQT